MVRRTFKLSDLNFASPLIFSGAEFGQQIFFPIPSGAPLQSAEVQLIGNYLRSTIGHLAFLVSANDVPTYALEPADSEGTFNRLLAIPTAGLDSNFVKVDLKFSSVMTENRCSDQRSIANVVAVSPLTELRYDVLARDVTNVRTAWSMLPPVTRILVPDGPMTEAQYAAAVKVALAVSAAGRKPVITSLPKLGSAVDVSGLAVPSAFADIAAFQKFRDMRMVTLASPADRGAYMALLAYNNTGVGEILLGADWLRRAMTIDISALRTVTECPEALRLLDALMQDATEVSVADKDDNLRLISVHGQPVILLDKEASAAASLLGTGWAQLASAAHMEVNAVKDLRWDGDTISLSEFTGNFATQSIVEYGDWLTSFNISQLPANRWPSAVELEMRVSPDSSDAAPVVTVTLNDVLLQARKINPKDEVVRLVANIPPYVLASQNTLRIAVQRSAAAGDCRALTRGYPAQILPTSHLVLDNESLDNQFFSVKPKLAARTFVAVPAKYLAAPLESLPFVQSFLGGLNIPPSALLLKVTDEKAVFSPSMDYVAFGLTIPGRRKNLSVADNTLHLTDEAGVEIAHMKGTAAAALAQVITINDHVGVSINTTTGSPIPGIVVDDLSVGDVAIYDATGRIGELGAAESRRVGIRSALLEPSALLYRYNIWILVGAGILAALIVMRLVRAIVENRKFKQLTANTPPGEPPHVG